MSRPERTAFTAYYALSDMAPDDARLWLDHASPADLADVAARDLRLAYGWRLPLCVDRVAIPYARTPWQCRGPGIPGVSRTAGSRENSSGPI